MKAPPSAILGAHATGTCAEKVTPRNRGFCYTVSVDLALWYSRLLSRFPTKYTKIGPEELGAPYLFLQAVGKAIETLVTEALFEEPQVLQALTTSSMASNWASNAAGKRKGLRSKPRCAFQW